MLQENQWGLEDLELYLDVGGDHMMPGIAQDVTVQGLVIQGASLDANKHHLVFSDDLACSLPPCKLKWRLKSLRTTKTTSASSATTLLPVYAGETRKALVCQVLVATDSTLTKAQWAQRSVALLSQAPLN